MYPCDADIAESNYFPGSRAALIGWLSATDNWLYTPDWVALFCQIRRLCRNGIFRSRLADIEKSQKTWEQMPVATQEDIDNLFRVEGNTLIIGDRRKKEIPSFGKNDVGNIPVESAFLLVYAADNDGRILKLRTLSSQAQVTVAGKQFMANNSPKESARWVEALDRLISWGWVKPVGYKGELFELTGTGYSKAEWLKEGMQINTDNEPLIELKGF